MVSNLSVAGLGRRALLFSRSNVTSEHALPVGLEKIVDLPKGSSLEQFNEELRAADESLVGNEEVLRAVLAGCGDCIKILDLDGRLQFMSEGGKRVMEVEDFGALKGCPWPDFWALEGNDEAKSAIAAARKGQTYTFKGAANTVKGTPRYWNVQVTPIFGNGGQISHLLSISRDITAEHENEIFLRESAERQQLLTQEMHHRINNTVSIIGAIASQTLRGNDLPAARSAFLSRLSSLADANKLLLQTDWESAPVLQVVEQALAPHDPGNSRITIDGPAVALSPKQALSLALAVHELATNAAKYGALSNDAGKVAVTWQLDRESPIPELSWRWEEIGGPQIQRRELPRKGFGSRLINGVLPHDFRGHVVLSYTSAGLVCDLRAPLSALPGERDPLTDAPR